jgi:cell wall-associated NlpC family hydrolase
VPDLNDAPQQNGRDGMVLGTNRSRLAAAAEVVAPPEARYTFAESAATFGRYRQSAGIDNPYGSGVAAYEPNTILFSDYKANYQRVQQSKSDEQLAAAVKSASTSTYNFGTAPGTGGAGAAVGRLPNLPDATGQLGKAIDYALDMANRRVPYVWGGTSLNGADCSGMLLRRLQGRGHSGCEAVPGDRLRIDGCRGLRAGRPPRRRDLLG